MIKKKYKHCQKCLTKYFRESESKICIKCKNKDYMEKTKSQKKLGDYL